MPVAFPTPRLLPATSTSSPRASPPRPRPRRCRILLDCLVPATRAPASSPARLHRASPMYTCNGGENPIFPPPSVSRVTWCSCPHPCCAPVPPSRMPLLPGTRSGEPSRAPCIRARDAHRCPVCRGRLCSPTPSLAFPAARHACQGPGLALHRAARVTLLPCAAGRARPPLLAHAAVAPRPSARSARVMYPTTPRTHLRSPLLPRAPAPPCRGLSTAASDGRPRRARDWRPPLGLSIWAQAPL
nr:extensin-like [Aegilops tauschii subsp. strangulata]